MLFRQGFTRRAQDTIKAAFKAQYHRDILIPTAELEKFLQKNGLLTEGDAVAHFNRVIAYYARNSKFVPSWKHLISPKVPVIQCAAEWDSRVAKKWPYFRPWMFRPTQSDFAAEYDIAALLNTQESIDMAADFSRCVMDAYRLTYVPKAVRLLERLVYTVEYRNIKTPRIAENAISAHNRLRAVRVAIRDTKDVWLRMPWHRALVRQQHIEYRNMLFTFWELPKLVCSAEAYKATFGKFQSEHDVNVLLDIMIEYGQRYALYTQFLLECRESFLLTGDERSWWVNNAPMGIKNYPHYDDGGSYDK